MVASKAYALRKQRAEIWEVLADAYHGLGDAFSAGFWRGMVLRRNGGVLRLPKLSNQREEALRGIGYAYSNPRFAPYHMVANIKDGKFAMSNDVVLGAQLPTETNGQKGYWVGLYNPRYPCEVRGILADTYRSMRFDMIRYGDMIYDLMRAEKKTNADIPLGENRVIVQPVGGTEIFQPIRMLLPDGRWGTFKLSKYEINFLRISESTKLVSEKPFWFGKPIRLHHSKKCRKVVINILVDALSWMEQKKENFRNVPNIMRFFSKGIIFDHTYSGSEFTYPSLSTIETGLLPHHSQIFHAKYPVRLEAERLTLSEQMHRLGYYCVNIQGASEGVFSGVTRGYDRLVVNHYVTPAYVGVERIIRQLESLGETDQFIFMHCLDCHPNNNDMKCPETVQTKLPLEDQCDTAYGKSVNLIPTHRMQSINRQNIKDMDRQMGVLFEYLQERYTEDEYFVCLYSDHGCSIYSEKPWLLNALHSNCALMIRGGGVPNGLRPDELVSTADIYAILGHYCGYPCDDPHLDSNLPEACGGKRRNMVISQSIYPGQTRKLCLRTEQYACRFETEALTQEDGTVDASQYTVQVFLRKGTEEDTKVEDEIIRNRFLQYISDHAEDFMLRNWRVSCR